MSYPSPGTYPAAGTYPVAASATSLTVDRAVFLEGERQERTLVAETQDRTLTGE